MNTETLPALVGLSSAILVAAAASTIQTDPISFMVYWEKKYGKKKQKKQEKKKEEESSRYQYSCSQAFG